MGDRLLGVSPQRLRTALRTGASTPQVLRLRRRLASRLRDLSNRFEGAAYRVRGDQPDPAVDDDLLAQRIRSSLGPLEKRLDLPRLHVTVTDHVAHVRGVVDTREHALQLEHAVREVSGVRGVRSYLRIGLGPGDTRPSQGRAQPPTSEAWHELVGAVRETGVDDDGCTAERLTTAILVAFLDAIPEEERRHVVGHLPRDVRQHLEEHVRVGLPSRPTTIAGFERAILDGCPIPRDSARLASRSLLATLRELVPEEVADVEAVLPRGMKGLWRRPVAPVG